MCCRTRRNEWTRMVNKNLIRSNACSECSNAHCSILYFFNECCLSLAHTRECWFFQTLQLRPFIFVCFLVYVLFPHILRLQFMLANQSCINIIFFEIGSQFIVLQLLWTNQISRNVYSSLHNISIYWLTPFSASLRPIEYQIHANQCATNM